MKTITRAQALRIVHAGGEVYAVPEGPEIHLFDDAEGALACAEKVGAADVLDWETGQRADL